MNTKKKQLKGLLTSEIQIVLLAKFIIRAKNMDETPIRWNIAGSKNSLKFCSESEIQEKNISKIHQSVHQILRLQL